MTIDQHIDRTRQTCDLYSWFVRQGASHDDATTMTTETLTNHDLLPDHKQTEQAMWSIAWAHLELHRSGVEWPERWAIIDRRLAAA